MNEPVTREDADTALAVLRVAARWALTPARWSDVGSTVAAMRTAVTVNDGQALRAGIRDLTFLGPARGPTVEVRVAAPGQLLDDFRELADAHAELTEQGRSQPRADDARAPRSVSLPVTIYLRDESGHELVERAVDELVATAGFVITERNDPVSGSWFRRMRATLAGAARSPEGRALIEATTLRADLELIQRPDAEVAALWMANIAPLLATLQSMGDAVIYLGVVLIVKSDGKTFVYKLSTHQQRVLNDSPHLLTDPESILRGLGAPAGHELPLPHPGGLRP